MIRQILFALSLLVSAQSPSYAQPDLRREDLCPSYDEIDPLLNCQGVGSYADLAEILDSAPSGAEISLCPFFVRKVTSVEPITVKKGVQVHCARLASNQFCTILGLGTHLIIDTSEDTMWQGFSFRGSNDHAVYISGDVENAELGTHTFCHTSFLENVRTKDTRGGALMLQRSAGTVNVVECFFQDNFSKTYGAAIYSRASQLNIIFSLFVKNKSTGYGPAIFTAMGGGLMVKTSSFKANRGREGFDIVFNPGTGTAKYEDGLDNVVDDVDCRGVYHLVEKSCITFEESEETPLPTILSTATPTSRPTKKSQPTQMPTKATTAKPTSSQPLVAPTSIPASKLFTVQPTNQNQTGSPVIVSTLEPIIESPVEVVTTTPTDKTPSVSSPTIHETVPTSLFSSPEPTLAPKPPTRIPTSKPSTTGGSDSIGEDLEGKVSNKCLFQTIPAERECDLVESFEDFKLVIESGRNDVIFCGGFTLPKVTPEPVQISNSIDIRCVEQCSFYGIGPFLKIGGPTKIRLKNFKFFNSQDSSAIMIATISSIAHTTICDTEFARNQVSMGNNHLGGALTVESRSGVVNVVNNTFTANIASRGGAIHSNGFRLNIVRSKFVANNAYHSGNAIFVGDGNHLSVQSSTFILNTEVATRSGGREGRNTDTSVAIAVQPNKSIRVGSHKGTYVDGGSNQVILSGYCGGFYLAWKSQCDDFK